MKITGITAATISVNKVFFHWIMEINIKRYGDDMPILPLSNIVNIYRYSDELLKHMSKDALKKYKMICYIAQTKLQFTAVKTIDVHIIQK